MCYFLAIGATTEPWRLSDALERELTLELDTSLAPAPVGQAFPTGDTVRMVTHRGCSCALFEIPIPPVQDRAGCDLLELSAPCRRALARAAHDWGDVRLYVLDASTSPASARRWVAMKSAQLAQHGQLPTNALVEIERG